MLTGKIHFAQKVGVAPSTTTIELGGAGGGLGIQCFPVPSADERAAWIAHTFTPAAVPASAPPPARARRLNPYASEVEMRGLGVPSNSYAWRTGRPYSQPPGSPRGTTALVFSGANVVGQVDPNDAWPSGWTNRDRTHGTIAMRISQRSSRGYTETLYGSGLGISSGEMARSLSGLGTVPNDDELARNLCYTPVHSGWIYGNTPTGEKYYVDGLYGSAAAALLSDDPASALADIVAIQRKQMIFQGITTAAIVSAAVASVWSAFRAAGLRKRVKRAVKKRRRR